MIPESLISGSQASVFGTPNRQALLVCLAALEESYPRELARVSGAPYSVTVREIDRLEAAGVIVSRTVGRQRRLEFNRRWSPLPELRALLLRLLDQDQTLQANLEAVRRRPRQRGQRA